MEAREPSEENRKLLKRKKLRAESWLVIWEDNNVLEVISKRSKQRRVLKKNE